MEASTPPHGRCLSLSPTRSTPVARGPHERRCTRYVAMHPIRRGVMPTDRVHRLPQQAQPRAIRPHRPQPSTSDAATQLRHARPAPNERRYTRYVALHPLRRATPVTSRRTRYVALHPIRRGAMPTDRVHRLPQQAQPRAIRPHRPQPSTSDAETQLRHARADSAQEPLHPLRRAAPVTSRRTRYVAIHPIRRGAMPTDRVHRHLTTSPIEEKLVLTAPTSPNRAAADSATPLSNMPPSGSIVPSATSYAWRSVLAVSYTHLTLPTN